MALLNGVSVTVAEAVQVMVLVALGVFVLERVEEGV